MNRAIHRQGRNPLVATGTGAWLTGFCLLLLGLATAPLEAQGMVGGKARPPVFDELNRPITAGGFVDGAPVVFSDITHLTGLDAFRHRAGSPEKRFILETMTGGVALLDYNRDGWIDVYLVSGSTFEAIAEKEEHPASRLFRNNGDGSFTDTTAAAGVANRQWGFGVASADFDSDGWPDLYVSNYGDNRLYRSNGDGTFTDVAPRAGVAASGVWTTGASFGDYDGDGLLDLYVAGYATFDREAPPQPGVNIARNYCRFRGSDVMCGPRGLTGARDFLFRNRGDGTFEDVTTKAGVTDREGYYGFTPAWIDINDDGRLDLIVINDSTPNYLYLNRGDGTFEDVSYISGFALNQDGREQAGMGLALGDYNHDGHVDVYVTHFSDDYSTLYENQGDTFFLAMAYERGLGEGTIPFVSWGTAFIDYDNDSDQDLFLANGHVYPSVDDFNWGTTWAQRPLLFANLDGARFEEVPPATGSGLSLVVSARGAAFGDLDNDGRIDVVLNCVDSPPRVLKNVTETTNNWITLKLVSRRKSPPDGIGSTLYLSAAGRRQRRDVYTGGSFASSSDPRIHFGLGSAQSVDRLEIRWAGGGRQTLTDLPVNRILEIHEMKPHFKTLELHPGSPD